MKKENEFVNAIRDVFMITISNSDKLDYHGKGDNDRIIKGLVELMKHSKEAEKIISKSYELFYTKNQKKNGFN